MSCQLLCSEWWELEFDIVRVRLDIVAALKVGTLCLHGLTVKPRGRVCCEVVAVPKVGTLSLDEPIVKPKLSTTFLT